MEEVVQQVLADKADFSDVTMNLSTVETIESTSASNVAEVTNTVETVSEDVAHSSTDSRIENAVEEAFSDLKGEARDVLMNQDSETADSAKKITQDSSKDEKDVSDQSMTHVSDADAKDSDEEDKEACDASTMTHVSPIADDEDLDDANDDDPDDDYVDDDGPAEDDDANDDGPDDDDANDDVKDDDVVVARVAKGKVVVESDDEQDNEEVESDAVVEAVVASSDDATVSDSEDKKAKNAPLDDDPGYKFVPVRKKPLYPPKSTAEKKKEAADREERKKKRIENFRTKHPLIVTERQAPQRQAFMKARQSIERQSLSQRQQATRQAAEDAAAAVSGNGKKKRKKRLKGTKRVFRSPLLQQYHDFYARHNPDKINNIIYVTMNTEVTNLITPRDDKSADSSDYVSDNTEESKKKRKKDNSRGNPYSAREFKQDLVKAYTWPDFTEHFAAEIPAPNLQRDSADNFAKNIRKVKDHEFEYKKKVPLVTIDEDALRHFIAKSFKKFDWPSEREHNQIIASHERAKDAARRQNNQEQFLFHKRVIRAATSERKIAREKFKEEWLVTQRGYLHGLCYHHHSKQFTGLIRYYHKDEDGKAELFHENDVVLNYQWLKDCMKPQYIQDVVSFSPDRKGFLELKEPVQYEPEDCAIVKIRLNRKKNVIKQEGLWRGQLANGKTVTVEEDWIRDTFGDRFIEALNRNADGFIEVPVGDNKLSHLHEYQHLRVQNAPQMKYRQQPEGDQCLTKSFASVLYHMGLYTAASEIDKYGSEELYDEPLNMIKRLNTKARSVLPTCIVSKKISVHFDWEKDLKHGEILVGVIRDRHGYTSHGISIFNGFIYDANEREAIRLCKESLDYCTIKNDGTRSKFEVFKAGYVFYYQGKAKKYLKFMNA